MQDANIERWIGEILESGDSINHRQEIAGVGNSEVQASSLSNDPCPSYGPRECHSRMKALRLHCCMGL
jgi:hypothetical protein